MNVDEETETRMAELLLKATSDEIPDTNAEKFARLGERNILSEETTAAMQEAARFRNVLTHTYGHDIDGERVYRHLQEDLHWFPTFLKAVRVTVRENKA